MFFTGLVSRPCALVWVVLVCLAASAVPACAAAGRSAHDVAIAGATPTPVAVQTLVHDAALKAAGDVAMGAAAEVRALGVPGVRVRVDLTLLDNDAQARVCDAVGVTFEIGTQAEPTVTCGPTRSTGCTSTCTADMVFSDAKDTTLRAAVTEATAQLAALINVIAPSSGVTLPTSLAQCGTDTFGSVPVPASYLGTATGDTDLIIFLTRRPTLAGVASYGVECLTDQNGRPIAGHINIAPQYIDPAALNTTIHALMQELVHVMGFSTAAFPRFVNSLGQKYSDLGLGPTAVRTTAFGSVVTRFEGPRVVGLAKQFWDCATAVGVELENGGGSNVALSHWEKRQMGNELMTETTEFPTPVLSIFTLALLEDSGWYRADYAAAQPFRWGYRGGCAWFDGQCKDFTGYFCAENGARGCTADRLAPGVCTVTEWTGIPTAYQYFGNDVLGGDSILADFCPFYLPTNGAADACSVARAGSSAGEVFGADSRCFSSTLANSSATYTGRAAPACYSHQCTGTAETGYILNIAANGQPAQACPQAGGRLVVSGLVGAIECPPVADVCGDVTLTSPPDSFVSVGAAVTPLIALVLAAALVASLV